jgi:hypothetical protein
VNLHWRRGIKTVHPEYKIRQLAVRENPVVPGWGPPKTPNLPRSGHQGPKPTLLTYKKLGMVGKSIYWPGVFGYGATLVDSHLHPKFDDKRKSLYLCSDLQNPQSCQKYQVIADDGLISAIKSYF